LQLYRSSWLNRMPRPARRSRKVNYKRGLTSVLHLERLEDRVAPASWTPIGPAPQHDPSAVSTQPNEDVTGRISALMFAKVNGLDTLYLGAAGGGVWTSTNFNDANPTWATATDNLPVTDARTGLGAGAIDVGTLAQAPCATIDIFDGTG